MGGFRNDNGIQFEDIAEANEFVFICWIFYHILPFVMLFNAMALVYFYYVIVTFHSFKFCKWCLILMMVVEWLAVAGLTALYYLSFDLFWNEYLKENREESIYHDEEHEYEVFWCPDWGIIVILVMEWYMLKLIAYTFKA